MCGARWTDHLALILLGELVGMPLPLVSILTPVYNGAEYLRDCIESVLAQSYSNWEYIIVNNCSADGTLEIANEYKGKDRRIQVLTNDHFVGAIENHNIAFRCIANNSRYCKVVSADDWIYPECVEKFVDLAEQNPQVGVVQAYIANMNGVRWPGLPQDAAIFSGQEICRLYLLGKIDFAAMPSAVLYRSSLVRSRDCFFPGSTPIADAAAYLNCLRESDLGFVHQILSFERLHENSVTAKISKSDSYLLDRIALLMEYGPILLTPEELTARLEERLDNYYRVLAECAVNGRSAEFWRYHSRRLEELGYRLLGARLTKSVCLKLLDLSFNPKQTVGKILRRVAASKARRPQGVPSGSASAHVHHSKSNSMQLRSRRERVDGDLPRKTHAGE
jgi:glycosyltransferase involved in cell wall biosynthesis